MKIKYFIVAIILSMGITHANAVDEKFLSCGAGYILTQKNQTDGINVFECTKLWCRDLETGKTMGTGNSAASGYKSTPALELCDDKNNCVECHGDRKWCSGNVAGIWNPGYGAYTRGGADTATYVSYQKGDCFAWRLEKPSCENGQSAILQNGEWVCVVASGATSGNSRESAVRRSGTIRRMIR